MTEDNELSEREIEIIRLVATGASNKEIAKELFISPNTVKVHLRNIFNKLGVLSRTEATMTAIRMGLVDSPGTAFQQMGDEENLQKLSDQISQNVLLEEQSIFLKNKNRLIVIGALTLIIVLIGIFAIREIFFNEPPPSAIDPALIDQLSSNRWTSIESLPMGLSNMGFVRYENKFLLFGGEDSEGVQDGVWIYDIDNDNWTTGEKIPIAIKDIQAITISEKIYFPGGVNNDNLIEDSLWIYIPRSNEWESGKKMPFRISGYASVAFEGKIYLFGGFDGSQYLDSILLYDPEIDEWTVFGTTPNSVAYSSVAVVGGQIHLFGGKNEETVLDKHFIYYPQREILNENPWETVADLPEPRYGMNSIVLADMVYLAGGKNNNEEYLPPIQYLPPKDTWVEIDSPLVEIGLAPAVLPYETRLYIIGGLNSEGYSNQALVYQAVYTILVPVVR
ncbi:MAG TPA: LuxR C-terminal-related transcriptional regulator [Anaerolineaceae bacterium]|nr:LuxR C-terminal-related transcriptional regulator [Anaerolineaceae bacterium]